MIGVELPVPTIDPKSEAQIRLVEFDNNKAARLPRGSGGVLRIRAAAEEFEIPTVCTVYYRTESGVRGQSNMRRVGRIRDGYQSFVLDGPPLASLSESLTFSIRGLDDRLDDFSIDSVDPPSITAATVNVRYPDYLRVVDSSGGEVQKPLVTTDDIDRSDEYQSGMRIREGSRVTLLTKTDVKMGALDVYASRAADGEPVKTTAKVSADGRSASISIDDFRAATTLQLIPKDTDGIAPQVPYRYFMGVVLDAVPTLEIRLAGIGSSITPDAKLPMNIVAADDYGLKDVTVTTILETPDKEDQNNRQAPDAGAPIAEEVESEISQSGNPAAVDRPQIDRNGDGKWTVDLRELVSQQRLIRPPIGSSVSVVGEAFDRYDIGDAHAKSSEMIRLNVVTPDQLMSLLERRELELRGRLEQTVSELRQMRQTYDGIRLDLDEQAAEASDQTTPDPANSNGDSENSEGASQPTDADSVGLDLNDGELSATATESQRMLQIIRLRIQQSGLQTSKTRDELLGIVATLTDIVDEMTNNRIDTPDRQMRLIDQIQSPLSAIISDPLDRLTGRIVDCEQQLSRPRQASQTAVEVIALTDETISGLTAILDKMLDLESFNELLDLVRGLIDDQDQLLDDTKTERKKKVLDLFQ